MALLAAACLLLFPFVQIGENVDFMMRAGIAPLTMLAIRVAEALVAPAEPHRRWARTTLIAVLAIGAATPAQEVARSLLNRPAPRTACDVWTAWDQSFAMFGKATYFARLSRVPAAIRPAHPAAIPPGPARCWRRPWAVRRGA